MSVLSYFFFNHRLPPSRLHIIHRVQPCSQEEGGDGSVGSHGSQNILPLNSCSGEPSDEEGLAHCSADEPGDTQREERRSLG